MRDYGDIVRRIVPVIRLDNNTSSIVFYTA